MDAIGPFTIIEDLLTLCGHRDHCLHLVCPPAGLPVRYRLRPASLHDLTPLHELLWELPTGV